MIVFLYHMYLKPVGCDWVLHSNSKEDKCGICHGDGSSCETKKFNFNKTILSQGGNQTIIRFCFHFILYYRWCNMPQLVHVLSWSVHYYQTKMTAIWNNWKSANLLNEWARTIAKIIVSAIRLIEVSRMILFVFVIALRPVHKPVFTRSNFWSQLLLKFKEVSEANKHSYEGGWQKSLASSQRVLVDKFSFVIITAASTPCLVENFNKFAIRS